MPTNPSGYMKAYTSSRQRFVINALGGKCLICSSRSFLEVHHIFGYKGFPHVGRGKKDRVSDWLKNMDKICLLCDQHHDEYHKFCGDVVNRETLLDYILFKFIEHEEMRFI